MKRILPFLFGVVVGIGVNKVASYFRLVREVATKTVTTSGECSDYSFSYQPTQIELELGENTVFGVLYKNPALADTPESEEE